MRCENELMNEFMNWASNNEIIRAAILTSSRVNNKKEIDFLSDYDIELYVSDLDLFMNDNWLNIFGNIMVKWPYKPRSTGDKGWITRYPIEVDKKVMNFCKDIMKTK